MTIRDVKGGVTDRIPVENVLVSVSNKDGLELLIPGLLEVNPNVRFMSTGGTYRRLAEILEDASKGEVDFQKNLIEVSEYIEFPEMKGGLLKTLHSKIHAGILGERNYQEHQEYLKNLSKTVEFIDSDVKRVFDAEVGKEYRVKIVEGITAVYIDVAVVNLYPFEETVAKEGVTFEEARGNIDIGGPTMVRGAAKNFLSCAVLTDPAGYDEFLRQVRENGGCTTFDQRFKLSPKVFAITEDYDGHIKMHMMEQDPEEVRKCYEFVDGGE